MFLVYELFYLISILYFTQGFGFGQCDLEKSQCIAINECNAINRLALPICGFNGRIPNICCPIEISTSTLKKEAVTSEPEERISIKKCEEYSKLVTNQISALFLTANSQEIKLSVPKCEFTNIPLIVGGIETKKHEFPHMVTLGYGKGPRYNFYCGGSLISERFVLTAAHCLSHHNHGNPKVARIGEHNIKNDEDDAINIPIIDVTRHPDYNPPKKYNDIALLKLSRNVIFNEKMRPACLAQPTMVDVQYTMGTAVGWGQLGYTEAQSSVLQKVELSIVDADSCNESWKSSLINKQSELPIGINYESMICAGTERGKDTCTGDSGGPLSIRSNKNKCVHYIIGITSFGAYCGFGLPAIYTRVPYYIKWIEDIVWPANPTHF